MIKVVAKFSIAPSHIETFKKITVELIEETRKEDGCITYELFQDTKDSSVFSFIETWVSQEALKVHSNSKHFTKIVPQFEALQNKPAELNVYTLVR